MKEGFSVITGETGSGKSLVIEALKIILGEKTNASLIRNGEEKCSIEAIFGSLPKSVNSLLEEIGIETGEKLIIRRSFERNAGCKQWMNGSAVTLKRLKEIAPYLMNINDASNQTTLFRESFYFSLLDQEKETQKLLKEYQNCWNFWQQKKKYVQKLQKTQMSSNEFQFLEFQIKEIENINLEKIETLEEDYKRLRYKSDLLGECQNIHSLLKGKFPLAKQVKEILVRIKEIQKLDTVAFQHSEKNLQSLSLELQDFSEELENYSHTLDTEEEDFLAKEREMQNFDILKQKYGGTLESLESFYEEGKRKFEEAKTYESSMLIAEEGEKKEFIILQKKAKSLSIGRRKYLEKISQKISSELAQLGFPNNAASFVLSETSHFHFLGGEKISLLFSPNTGELPKEVESIASSGERARIIISLCTCSNQKEETTLIIFDEIDANIGGEIGNTVGEKMRKLAKKRQVLVITHFPQVAVYGENHYGVQKRNEKQTYSELNLLTPIERKKEIQRMFGNKGDISQEMAKELLRLTSNASAKRILKEQEQEQEGEN